jgi:hypothetical protein
LGHVPDGDVRLEVGRVHGRVVGGKDERDAFVAQQRQVARQVARVAAQVFGRRELRRVDVDADGHVVVLASRPAHQFQMPLMQVAHGGHKAERGHALRAANGPDFFDGSDNFHALTSLSS